MELKTGSDLSVRYLDPRPDTAGAEETDEGQRGIREGRMTAEASILGKAII